jgi:uncharacterized membrane protein (DUF4010 family)
MFINLIQPFAIALVIGLAVGIDRERRAKEGEGTMGVRTFAILTLLGAVAGALDNQAVTFGILFLLSLIIACGYIRVTGRDLRPVAAATSDDTGVHQQFLDLGLTTEVSAALVFAIGYLTNSDRMLAGIIGIALATILHSRRFLHFFFSRIFAAS